jgi:hypothetical protein
MLVAVMREKLNPAAPSAVSKPCFIQPVFLIFILLTLFPYVTFGRSRPGVGELDFEVSVSTPPCYAG